MLQFTAWVGDSGFANITMQLSSLTYGSFSDVILSCPGAQVTQDLGAVVVYC